MLADADPSALSHAELVQHMVGRAVAALSAARPSVPPDTRPALELAGVAVERHKDAPALEGIDLTVRAGELVGVAGVAGNGQRELFEVALGLLSPSAGTVAVGGQLLRSNAARAALRSGAVGIPEDPVSDAVVPGLSVAEHIALADLSAFRKGVGVDWRQVRNRLEGLDKSTNLRVAAGGRVVTTLSGGNIQRLMLVRALGAPVNLIVAAYPCRGLDIASTRRTQELLLQQRADGAGVLLISEDLDELMELSDRLLVLHGGRMAGVVDPRDVDRYAIGRLMLEGEAA
jgi:simple sugar transport system ATP-binding protein